MTTTDLLSSLVAPAVAIAVNPVPVMASVTLLTTAHGKRNALYFITSMWVIMLAVGTATIIIAGNSGSSSTSTGGAAIEVAFGVIFLAVAVQQWWTKPVEGKDPGWMKALDKTGLVAGVTLAVSLTNYALLTTGVDDIARSGLSTSAQIGALVFFVAIATSTVVLPLIMYLVRPVWARTQLGRLRDWLMKHSRVILITVFALMGVLFVTEGINGLLS